VTISAAAAYRLDAAGRTQNSAVDDDDRAIVAGAVLQHAALLPAPQRSELLRDAIEVAIEIVGEPEVERLAAREWQDVDRTPSEAITLLAETVQRAGSFNLARVLLDGVLQADDSLTVVQRGRVLAARARIAWKLGSLDDARERYELLERLGRNAKSAELKARACVGLASVAYMRGNYPELQRYAARAARIADREGFRELGRKAHNALLIVAGANRQLDAALSHGWSAYQASDNPVDACEVLQNIGQVLFDAGQVDTARAVFATVVSHELPALILLPALGGLALASAKCGMEDTVRWAATEVTRIDASIVPRYALASALTECASGLNLVGRRDDAERCRAHAAALATANGFHEIAYRIDAMPAIRAASAEAESAIRRGSSAKIVTELKWMEPERRPDHVRLAAAPV